jgi:hypothetical protein
MARDWMQYDRVVQAALKGVVRQILRRVHAQGLPGDHHLYLVFRTTHPGVVIPGFLRERYPDEMTIVLQHQFWGLEVFEDKFRVGLSFNKSPQELTIPFSALKGFFDPSVQFGLQFDIEDLEAAPELTGAASQADGSVTALTSAKVPASKTSGAKGLAERASSDDVDMDAGDQPGLPSLEAAPPSEPAKDSAKGEVVSLDSFRKK